MSTFRTRVMRSEVNTRISAGLRRRQQVKREQSLGYKLVAVEFVIFVLSILFCSFQLQASIKPVQAFSLPKQYPSFVGSNNAETDILMRQTYDLAVSRGVSRADIKTMFKIIDCESSWKPSNYHSQVHASGVLSTDRGLAMINDFYHKEVSNECAFDSRCSIEKMIDIARKDNGFSAWACAKLIK